MHFTTIFNARNIFVSNSTLFHLLLLQLDSSFPLELAKCPWVSPSPPFALSRHNCQSLSPWWLAASSAEVKTKEEKPTGLCIQIERGVSEGVGEWDAGKREKISKNSTVSNLCLSSVHFRWFQSNHVCHWQNFTQNKVVSYQTDRSKEKKSKK